MVREIPDDEKLDVVGRPELVITKMAPGSPVEFTAKYALLPEVGLPDYKKIAAEIAARKEVVEVTETGTTILSFDRLRVPS